MSGGITAQYGFLYQRYSFIKLALDNAGMDKFFVYEGIDDIDITEEQRISAIKVSGNIYAQVKSGIVSQDCWAKVIGNWLLIDEDNPAYRIILENELAFDVKADEVISGICDYFIKGATKARSSIANKVYKKFLEGNEESDENLKNMISKLLEQISCEVLPLETIKASIEETFKSIYCQDIKVYEMAKVCRCERFIEYINAAINEAIEKKKSFTLRFVDYMAIINKVTSEISDRKYTIDIGEMKKRKKTEAERLMNSDVLREVRQLRLVNSNSGFIVNELLKEMLYRDFRNVYSTSESTLISNIEETAHSNFQDAIYSLVEGSSPMQVFDKTVNKDIPLSIVNNSPLYRHGCYVFLTSDETDKSRQITWGEEYE